MPQVRTVLSTAGGGFLGTINTGDIYVRIAPHSERYITPTRIIKGIFSGEPLEAFRGNYTQSDVMTEVRQRMRKFKDITVRPRSYPSFNIGGGNFDIDLSLTGPDLNKLAEYSAEIAQRANDIGGIINIDTTLKLNKPEMRVNIDRERAADLGISSRDIGTALRLMVGGDEEISRYRDRATDENYDVRLRLASRFRETPDQLPQLLLTGESGRSVELRNIATLEPAFASPRIDRLDRNRDARIRGSLAPGYALAERLEVIQQQVDEMNLDPGYVLSIRGAGREFERTYMQFIFAFGLSVIFMYMILASQYEHLVHPVTILLSLPLAVPFALFSLWITGQQLNLYSALGILVLFGVVKKNSILQVDHMNQLRSHGMKRHEAVMEGNRDRLRPILMTTLALVAGMLPLALGTGPGAEERRAVAVVVIGGQTLSLLLTLLVTPVAYTLLDDLGEFLRGRRGRNETAIPAEASAIT
jgi:HAE1 family hydrophobic/amphiphilic exporter-1